LNFEFSYQNRPRIVDALKSSEFDLLVIGGGITGAGIALDAASRGLKTALVEKNDFAFGTSSRSTKLIHGGLRYLKQLEFGLVKEVGSERAVVHKLAPHLVIPEKMLLPLYEKRGFGSLLTSVGLALYDWLAGVKKEDRRRMLTRRQTLKQEPLLRELDVKGGAIYAEYRTDDARLTIEIVKTAFKQGAWPLSYAEVTELLYDADRKLTGARINDHFAGGSLDIKAKAVVNAAGPWVDELREKDGSRQGKRLHLTKGVHIVVAHPRFPVRQAIYFNVDDGRMIFAIPRGKTTYIGTTDTNYTGSKDRVAASREDVDYLLRAVNATFSPGDLNLADVMSSWAGLRPLIFEEGKSASELSRKDEIFESDSGLISIAGGKLTGYRKMAERVVDLVSEKFFSERNLEPSRTASILLEEPGFANFRDVGRYKGAVSRELLKLGGSAETASYLVHTYGRNTNGLVSDLKNNFRNADNSSLTTVELDYALHNEMALTPLDFLVRRTGMLFFDIERTRASQDQVLATFRERFGWSDTKMAEERTRIAESINFATQFFQTP
jgi:glycerol-3-phosphate dehydrogenase